MPLIEKIPNGLCRCGCGEEVYTRKYAANRHGKPNIKYQTYEFIRGHNQRVEGRSSVPTLVRNTWPLRTDTIDPEPILKLVEDRKRRYLTSIKKMEEVTGIHWLHGIKNAQYMLKPTAVRVLNALAEHFPYKGYVPAEGEVIVEPRTSAFNYVTPKPTGIKFYPNDPDWGESAACKRMPLHVFFPTQVASTGPSVRDICAGCPVADDCFGTALSFGEEHGVWGGVWFGNTQERKIALETYMKTHNMAKTRAKVVEFARSSNANRKK